MLPHRLVYKLDNKLSNIHFRPNVFNICKEHIWFEHLPTFHNLLGKNENQGEHLKSNVSEASKFDQGYDESIGIGFIVSGLIILVLGFLMSCIINYVFSID